MANLYDPRMENPAPRTKVELLASFKWGEKITALCDACGVSALDVEAATKINNDKVGRWQNKPVGEGRPLARVDEAWVLAVFFAGRLGVEPCAILEYLINDDQPIDTPMAAIQAAWKAKFTPAPIPLKEGADADIVRVRRGVPTPKKRERSRADTKRKHLAG